MVQSSPSDLVALSMSAPYDDTFTSDGFGMTIDGVELAAPLQQLARGVLPNGVAVLAGSNLDEGTEFMSEAFPIECNASAAELLSWSVLQFGPVLGPQVGPAYAAASLEAPFPRCYDQQHHHHGAGPPPPPPPPTTTEWVSAMRAAGDAAIGCRARELLYAARRAGSDQFRYLFTVQPNVSVNWPPGTLEYEGAFHGAEVPFVFNDLFELSGPGERQAASAMGCWWTNFAATGNPNVGPTGCAAGLPEWPVSGAGGDAMVITNTTLGKRSAVKKVACDIFSKFA